MYPNHFHEIIGLTDEFGQSGFYYKDTDTFAIFGQRQYPTAIRLYELLIELKNQGILKDDIVISTNETGTTVVSSESANEMMSQTLEEDHDSDYGWKLKDDFFGSASEEQWNINFEAIYSKSGIPGYNVLHNPNKSAQTERLIGYLYSQCLEVVTVRTHTNEPDSLLVIFLPKAESKLSDRLGITSLSSINIVDAADEPTAFPWKWNFRYDDDDRRYSISRHIDALDELDEENLKNRLDYFKQIIRELNDDLHHYVDLDSEQARSRTHEIETLIMRLKTQIVKAHNEWGYDSDSIDFDKHYSISSLIGILPDTQKTRPLEWPLQELKDELNLYRSYTSESAEMRIHDIQVQIERIEKAINRAQPDVIDAPISF